MTDINLKTLTPDASLPTTGFLFGADSQASTNPSVYSTQAVATTLLGSTSLTGDTLTASAPVLNLAQTWNNGAVTFTGVKLNATDTASNAASLLMDLQVGATNKFKIDKAGNVFVGNPAAGFTNTGIIALGAAFGTAGGSSNVIAGEQLVFYSSNTKVGEYVFSTRLKNNSAFTYEWSSTGASTGATDLTIRRRGTANLQLGDADAASPVAQTLSVQSIVAGQTNASAALYPFTITGAQGTGSGAGGSIVFQVAPAGGSGSAQNALVTALTIGSDRSVAFGVSNGYISGNIPSTTLYFSPSGGVNFGFGLFENVGFGRSVRLDSTLALAWNSGGPSSGADIGLSRATAGVVQVGTTANNASGTLKAAVVGTTTAYIVATLPTGFAGARAYVTDATAPTYLGTLTGGGAVVCPVFYNGTAWVSA
jgi:hypothetical protein